MFVHVDTQRCENDEHFGEIEIWQRYGLKENPFSPKMEENYPGYLLPQWEEYLDLLQHLSRNNNVILAIVGQLGTGKTTLMNQFLVETIHDFQPSEAVVQSKLAPGEFWVLIEDTIRTCQVNADASLDPERLLDLLTEGFDLPWQSADSLDAQLDAQMENLQRCKQTCLLLIDDAHLLPPDTLRALLRMISQQSEAQMRLHVLLFGATSLKSRLNKIAVQQELEDATCILELKPLSRSETERYLQHRFVKAGLKGTLPLSAAHVTRIYKQSKGIPRQINQVTQHLLMSLTKPRQVLAIPQWMQLSHVRLMSGSLLVAFFIMSYLFIIGRTLHSSAVAGRMPQHLPAKLMLMASTIKLDHVVQQANTLPLSVIPTYASQVRELKAPSAPAVSGTVNEEAAKVTFVPLSQTIKLAVPDTKFLTVTKIKPSDQAKGVFITSNLNKTIVIKEDATAPNTALSAEVKDASITETDAKKKDVIADVSKKSFGIAKELPKETAREDITQETTALTQDASKHSESKLHLMHKIKSLHHLVPILTAQQVLKAEPHSYTLQLAGTSRELAATRLLEENHLSGKAMYVRTRHDGKEWYVVVYGQYASIEQARHAINVLPKPLRDMKPWVRSFSSVQAAMQDDKG